MGGWPSDLLSYCDVEMIDIMRADLMGKRKRSEVRGAEGMRCNVMV